jgi:hypothetical protein
MGVVDMWRTCRWCAGEFIAPHRRGRPQLYCSQVCKAQTKREVKRLNDRLARLEQRRAEVLALGRRWEQGMVPVLDRQIQEAGARLGALSGGSSPHTTQEDPARV